MFMETVDSFFDDLRAQVDQRIIVDDEETLARVALLVPVLLDALRRTLPDPDAGHPALLQAEETIRSVTAL